MAAGDPRHPEALARFTRGECRQDNRYGLGPDRSLAHLEPADVASAVEAQQQGHPRLGEAELLARGAEGVGGHRAVARKERTISLCASSAAA